MSDDEVAPMPDPTSAFGPEDLDENGPFGVKAEVFLRTMRNTHRKVAANLFRLRGELLAAAAEIEHGLDFAIRAFFEVPKEKSLEFHGWVLSELSVAQKISVFQRIVNPAKADYMSTFLKRLVAANSFRNQLAHSSVSVDFIDGALVPKSQWTKIGTDPTCHQTVQQSRRPKMRL
jgi:hypothetical protein